MKVPVVKSKTPYSRTSGKKVVAIATVDADDFERVVKGHTWTIDKNGYVYRRGSGKNGESATVLLHRAILKLKPHDGSYGDHKDGNRLNNSKTNLRVLTSSGNCQNKKASRTYAKTPVASGFRGVYRNTKLGVWSARVTFQGVRHFVGNFDNEIDAGAAAEKMRKKLMPMAVDGR